MINAQNNRKSSQSDSYSYEYYAPLVAKAEPGQFIILRVAKTVATADYRNFDRKAEQ